MTAGSSASDGRAVRVRDTRARRALLVAGTLPVGYALLILFTVYLRFRFRYSAPGLFYTSFPPVLANMLSPAEYGLIAAAIAWLLGLVARVVHRGGKEAAGHVGKLPALVRKVITRMRAGRHRG